MLLPFQYRKKRFIFAAMHGSSFFFS